MEEQYTSLFEQADTHPLPRKKGDRVGLLLVQSVCCVVLVLFFWLFRVLGGEGFVALKNAFYGALENNALMETVVGTFAERMPDETYETTATTVHDVNG